MHVGRAANHSEHDASPDGLNLIDKDLVRIRLDRGLQPNKESPRSDGGGDPERRLVDEQEAVTLKLPRPLFRLTIAPILFMIRYRS